VSPHSVLASAQTVLARSGRHADHAVYPVGGFTAYVVVSIIWLFVGGFVVGLLPLWEARKGIAEVLGNVGRDLKAMMTRRKA
jgi:hypothetical protein